MSDYTLCVLPLSLYTLLFFAGTSLLVLITKTVLLKYTHFFFYIFYVSSVFGLVLIFVDIILVIVDLSLSSESRESVGTTLEAISLVISFFFLIDVLLRIYVEGLVPGTREGIHVCFIYTIPHTSYIIRKRKSADKSGGQEVLWQLFPAWLEQILWNSKDSVHCRLLSSSVLENVKHFPHCKSVII